MARAKLQIHPLGLAVICFALVAWLIALGGVAGASSQCTKAAKQQQAAAAAAEVEAAAALAAAAQQQQQEQQRAAAAARAAAETEAEVAAAASANGGNASLPLLTPPPPVVAAAALVADDDANDANDANHDATPAPAIPVVAIAAAAASPSRATALAYASCAQSFQWEWFSLWFELALLIALFATALLPDAFRRGRAALLAFSTLSTLCLLLSAHNFITKVDISARVDVRDLDQDGVNAAAAGFVLLSLAMMALMIALGKDFSCAGCGQHAPVSPFLDAGAMGAGAGGPHGADYGAHVRYQANPPI